MIIPIHPCEVSTTKSVEKSLARNIDPRSATGLHCAMNRGPIKFRQRDVERLIRAAIAAGLKVTGVRADLQTGIVDIVTGESPAQDMAHDPTEANGRSDRFAL